MITEVFGVFGLEDAEIRERLTDVLSTPTVTAELTPERPLMYVRLTAPVSYTSVMRERFGSHCFLCDGDDLATTAVRSLQKHHKTVAVAESCTGGMVMAALTSVSGCSQVFGTGIVSYSCACKKELLHVRQETLDAFGAVSEQTAGEMARGVRLCAGADVGISVTGEAGPLAAEDRPVGTVFVGLADAKRTWVKELHLEDEPDRASIRRAATAHALDLLRRYWEAYPTVMAGGVSHMDDRPASKQEEKRRMPISPARNGSGRRRFWRVALLSVIVTAIIAAFIIGYLLLHAPDNNRHLQGDLQALYSNTLTDLTVDQPEESDFPAGMMKRFEQLYRINGDVGGWICIPNTQINYPVMRYANGYYQNHSFANQHSLYGQPYFAQNTVLSSQTLPRVYCIYGNNTQDEQMFSSLLSYRRIAFLQEHAVIEMNTLFEVARWEVFAVVTVDAADPSWDYTGQKITDDQSMSRYVDAACRRSLFRSDVTVSPTDRLLVLSTNNSREYGTGGDRFAVVARLLTEDSAATYRINVPVKETYEQTTTGSTTGTPTGTTTAAALEKTEPKGEASETATATAPTEKTAPDNGERERDEHTYDDHGD